MRKCELCDCTARMYCESDQASLCWDCDEKVHRANFLVAKHSRSLLCHVCQSITPWKASGDKLGPTVSVCDACVIAAQCRARDDGGVVRRENQSERSDGIGDVNEEVDDYDGDYVDGEDDYGGGDEEVEEEEGEIDLDEDDDENQVVPWSGESQSPPPVSCSSSSSSGSEDDVSLKRRRDFSDLYSDDDIGCSSSHIGSRTTAKEEASTSAMSSLRPLKQPRIATAASEADDDGQADSRSTAIIDSLHRLQKQMITNNGGDASATVLAICRLSKDESR